MSRPRAEHHLADRCLFRHLEGKTADRIAIRSPKGSLTYAGLAFAVSAGAADLAARLPGARRVLIACRDQRRVALAFFATLASGRIPLLADPTSLARLRAIVRRHAGASLVDRELAVELGGEVIPGEEIDAWVGRAVPSLPELHPAGPREEAFWVFSSGSTGDPRPVVHGHGAPAALFEGFARGVLGLGPDDVTVSTAGLPFVYALGNNLLFPLLAGASCILPDDLLLPTVLASLAHHGATVLAAGPWSLEALARLARREERAAPLRSLRLVLSAGETLPARVFHEWASRFGRPPLDNLGCTEMFNSFLSNTPHDAVAGSVGRPVAGTEIEVGEAPPRPGARGALRARGEGRALAVGEEEIARESWRTADEWCETGDEVEVGEDGRLRVLGRIDHRFKVKGRFVHPLAVERRLLEVEGVRECMVVSGLDEHGLACAVARVVLDGDDPARLRRRLVAHARASLDPHEVPARVEVVESLPRSTRGKLVRPAPGRVAGEFLP